MAIVHTLSLLVHLMCLGVFGASSVGGIALDRALWTAAGRGRYSEALVLAQTGGRLGRMAQFASLFTLASGLGMLASTNFVQWGGLWLYGKIALFIALGAYGGAVGGRAGRRLVALLSERAEAAAPAALAGAGGATAAAPSVDGELAALRSTFATFHVVMPAMLVAVLLLVVVR
jgi:hypothetical protein